MDDYFYKLDIERIQHEHDLEAARIIRKGKKETAAFLKLMEKAQRRAEQRRKQTAKAAPIETPSRKCRCGAPLAKRQRFCPKCRGRNRKKTKAQYQRKFRKSERSTVNEKTPL